MSIDLRIYDPTNTWSDEYNRDMTGSLPLSPPASGMEILAAKIVKYMLTSRGSDPLNPLYGGRAMHYTQVSESYIPTLRSLFDQDITECIDFIRQSETSNTEHKLGKIDVAGFNYGYRGSEFQLHVHLIVYDTAGNAAPLYIDR